MLAFYWIAGVLLALIWADRLRDGYTGMRTMDELSGPRWDLNPLVNGRIPRLSIIVPARNEEPNIEQALTSLLSLDYSDYEVIAIDDRSTDRTGELMERVAAAQTPSPRLRVAHISELPAGWLGKPHAMWLAAQQSDADWLLFTDADVVFRPDSIRRAVAYAETSGADHLVLFPTYRTERWSENVMLAGFALPFLFGHRPWKVADPDAMDFMGLGPFNMIRRTAYETIGTFRALRMEVIEDMKLGKLVKQHRLPQRNAFGRDLLSWHWGTGALGIARNLSKNFFALMNFNYAKAIGACLALAFLCLMPCIGIWLAPGWAKVGYAIALLCIAAIYAGMSRVGPVSAYMFLLLPFSTLLILYAMLRSMAHVLRHGGVVWRGTRYPLEELKRGLV